MKRSQRYITSQGRATSAAQVCAPPPSHVDRLRASMAQNLGVESVAHDVLSEHGYCANREEVWDCLGELVAFWRSERSEVDERSEEYERVETDESQVSVCLDDFRRTFVGG